jgi:hypothetical protein
LSQATVTYNESTCNISTCSDNSNTENKLHATLLQTVHFMPVKLKRKHEHVGHQAINILN